jgi:hypothetical protein
MLSLALLLLLLFWIVLPFAVFRVNPCSLFKLAMETRRMNKPLKYAKAASGATSDAAYRMG